MYYDINKNLINNYYKNKYNYKTLKNISNIKFDYINEIINIIIEEEDINTKFKYILIAYEKIILKKIDLIKFNKKQIYEENIINYNNDIYKLEDDKIINNNEITTKYKLKYYSILENLKLNKYNVNINENEFLCNILLTPSNIELSNKLPCYNLLSYYYKKKNIPELIYYIAKKCDKYEKMINNTEINPIFLIEIFLRTAHFLLIQKNYFYSIYFILKCKSLIQNNTNILKNIVEEVQRKFIKIENETYNYLLKEKEKFININLSEIQKIKKLIDSILEQKITFNINNLNSINNNFDLFAINKKWLIKAKIFIDNYIIMRKKDDEEFFLNEVFQLKTTYVYYLSNIKISDNIVAFPGYINNFEIISFKDYLDEKINKKNYYLLKELKLNEDYYLIKYKDWNEIKLYFNTTNEINIKDNIQELIELKFILFDKRINGENVNLNLLKKKYIKINKNTDIKHFKEKIINIFNSYFEIDINKKFVNIYKLKKDRKDILIEACYSYISNFPIYKSLYINKLDIEDEIKVSELSYKNYILIIEICNIEEPSFFLDINYQSKEIYKCEFCGKKIYNLNKKYNCDICNFSLFCSKECAKKSKNHLKLDNILIQILEKKFSLKNLLSNDMESLSLIDNKSLLGRIILKNTKDNYYINCVIQCLSNTEDLTKYFLNGYYLTEINNGNILTGQIYKLYYELLSKLWNKENEIITYNNLYPYISNEKKDPKKTLLAFLNKLNNELKRDTKQKKKLNEPIKNIEEDLKNYYNSNSIISDLFQGTKKISIKCCNCKHSIEEYENFLNLELNIPKIKTQIQIKLFTLNKNYIDLNFNLNEELRIKDVIQKATSYLKKEKYILKIIEQENKNKNESIMIESILYNSIEVVEFNNEYKITNIYTTNYENMDHQNNFDNLKLLDYYKSNNQSELVLYEREINKKETYLYIYPIKEIESQNLINFKNNKEDKILSYPFIIYIKNDDVLEKLPEIIFPKIKNILIKKSGIRNITICYPHFLYNWGNIGEEECFICKEIYYNINNNHCNLLKELNNKMKISELIQIVQNNKIILFVISKYYDLKKSIYPGITLFKDISINENISNTVVSIYDSFNLFKEDIILDNYYCKNCNKENKAIINNRINKSPLYLIVSLNRFIEEEQKLIVNPNIPEIL